MGRITNGVLMGTHLHVHIAYAVVCTALVCMYMHASRAPPYQPSDYHMALTFYEPLPWPIYMYSGTCTYHSIVNLQW